MHYQYLNEIIPAEIAENLKEFFPEHGDISYEEFLLQQESVYQSIQADSRNNAGMPDHAQSSNWSWLTEQGEECWQVENVESQIALDEALARSLQDLGEDFYALSVAELSGNESGSRGTTPVETTVRVVSQNDEEGDSDIDPDNMTYEQLQSLGDAMGHERKGLPQDLISQLPTFKYKSGSFFKKKKKEQCVICCMTYKNGDMLCVLPCAHLYHAECIQHWLELNKNCPVCQKEVKGDA